MQFLLTAYDGQDEMALQRRMNVRAGHLDNVEKMKEDGVFLFGGAILNDEGTMIGSMIVYEFPDRESLDERLKNEPYITGKVWQSIDIRPFRLARHN
jgi:uncharacterized protein YciI